jgi:hypothetical protein
MILDRGMELNFFHVQYPEGSGENAKKDLHLDKEICKTSKKAIIQIHNPWNSLCLPSVIVVTSLQAQKPEVSDPEWMEK